jgi:hypothetical protein
MSISRNQAMSFAVRLSVLSILDLLREAQGIGGLPLVLIGPLLDILKRPSVLCALLRREPTP